MSYDGSIKIDTSIDTKPFESGCSKLQSAAKTSASAVSSAFKVATAAIVAVGTGLAGAGTLAINTGIEFESAFAGVKKTVTATDEQLETLRDDILEMSKTVPQSASALAEIGEAAGQLGIKTDNIKDFTRVMADLGVATNMTSTEAATALARVANITGMPQTEFDKLGSTIVALGNNLATTEKEIVDMSLRLAGAGTQVGLTESDILSFAGALSSVGIEAEAGGTAFSTVMSRMSLAVAQGGEELSMFADVAGMTSDEFKTAFETNAAGAIISFIKGLDNINKSGGSAIGTLEEMELSDIRMRDALLRAANASDIFSDAIDLGAEAWQENNALTKEAEQRYETLESKLQLLKNRASILGIAFKDSIDDQLRSAVDQGIGYLDELTAAFESGGLPAAVNKAGDIFAEIAVKASQAAPKMIDAAVEFIQAFVDGIATHSDQISDAAVRITKALVYGLVDLLPSEVQKPIRETINAINRSLNNGTLSKTIQTIGKTFKSIGQTIIETANTMLPPITKLVDKGINVFAKAMQQAAKIIKTVAKTVFPPLSKAINLIADNLDIVLPLAIGVYTAFKTYKTITPILQAMAAATKAMAAAETAGTLATSAASGALTAKQILVGVLTGKITLATAAQWAWNVAMNANPIGLVIAAVAALAAGIGILCIATQEEQTLEERLSESRDTLAKNTEILGEKMTGIAEGMQAFNDKVSSADGVLEGFNDSLVLSTEKQQELASDMQEVQDEITEIARLATEERRGLTQTEIERLEDLFAEQKKLADQQLKVNQQYQSVVKDTAEDLVNNHDITVAEYEEYAADIIKSADETRTKTISAAQSERLNVLAEKRALIGTAEQYTEEWYQKEAEAANDRYEQQVESANKLRADTSKILADGYLEKNTALQQYNREATAINKQYKDAELEHVGNLTVIESKYNRDMKQLNEDYKSGKIDRLTFMEKSEDREEEYQKEKAGEEIRFNDEKNKIIEKLQKLHSDEVLNANIGTYTQLAADTELYGGRVTKEGEQLVENFTEAFKLLPEDMKQSMKDAINGAIQGLKENASSLWDATVGVASGVLGKIRGTFSIHSPSRKMRELFKLVWDGAVIETDDQATRVAERGKQVAKDFLAKTKTALNKNALVARMRAAVYGNQAAIASAVTAQVNHNVRVENGDYNQERVVTVGTVNAPISIDGREIAIATAPFMAEELAFT